MHWIRSRSSLGSSVALFALAVQLIVSFGHVHLKHSTPAGDSSRELRLETSAFVGVADLSAGDETPAGAHVDCAICALIHLAGTVIAPQPPTLLLPGVIGRAPPQPVTKFALVTQHHSPFPARAPPHA
ncbi:MAG: hypothetical protein ACJ8F3_00045 [Xanthobacteraceae bacterium]